MATRKAGSLAARYLSVLPVGYVEAVTPAGVVADLRQIERLKGSHDLEQCLYRDASDPASLRFKLIRAGDAIHLSDALPMMENMGLRVLTEHPYEIPLDDSRLGGETVHIQDFEVRTAVDVDVVAVGRAFEDAFEHIWSGAAESDGFNRLMLTARLTWRQVAMLRGYCKYLLQTGVPFSQTYMETTLNRYPLISRLLVELFESRFDPAHSSGKDGKGSHDEAMREKLRAELDAITSATLKHAASTLTEEIAYARALDRDAQIDACNDGLAILLENVASLDEDRILRSYIGVINATLRTSYYQLHDGKPREYISYKFDCAKILELPKPRPYREIFVYAPRVEGVHLRFGPVARGGLRWSDRREDFRTEVLGLVKAQMVKNTVIVPVGSKGGFYVKRPPTTADRDTQLAEGIACYKLFINGLLDITDNLVDGKTVHPQGVIRHDADDPYLVVAADKGTATFSDIANSVSAEHRYWLGDAFASGGSVGYDHKAMGITAKGAWESVKRHFRAMGRDSQTEDFTCVGIGDMSGDVFGNGMLLSRHIRLLAAFDHRHIFLDPNPDAEASFVERERMFRLPRSSWEDYDKSLISAGGGIHPRGAKSIRITPQVRAALDIAEGVEQMTPAELMAAILKSPVDLLWNGGIGTYVKAASETHADVGDRANNALRVNGRELRCRVVGEGGNLGMHPARPHRSGAARRAAQYRLHRQLRRRGHVRPRGQHQDPAERCRAARRADRSQAQYVAGEDDRRGWRPRPDRQLPAEPGDQPDGTHEPDAAGFQAAFHPHAGEAGPARSPDRVPAVGCRTRRSQGARPGPHPSGALDPFVLREDRTLPAVAELRRAGRRLPVGRTRALFPGAAAREVQRAHAAPPPAPRDRGHHDHQLHRQPRRRDLHAAHAGRHRPHARRNRQGLHDHPRNARRARALEADRRARRQGTRVGADRCAAGDLGAATHVHALVARAPGRDPGHRHRSRALPRRLPRHPRGAGHPSRFTTSGLCGQPARLERQGLSPTNWQASSQRYRILRRAATSSRSRGSASSR